MRVNYIVAGATDVGCIKQTNQDSYNARLLSGPWGRAAFAVLCDGMGGLANGEVASASLVRAFTKWTEERLPELWAGGLTDQDIRREWVGIATDFNEKIKLYGKRLGAPVGTTVTAALITDTRYYIMNVGDTRAYEIAASVQLLTRDHTLVAHEVSLGNLTPEQAEQDPRRSVLLQCVGASDAVYPDLFFGPTRQDAVYMLCSDGFRHEVSEEELFAWLRPEVMLSEDGMRRNIETVISLDKERQERDNITAIAIRTF